MLKLTSTFGIFTSGACVGLGITMLALPTPPEKAECSLYKVSSQVATSYVLKPPPAPDPEKVIVKEACVTPKSENVSKPETTNTDDTPERPRRRHRRMRAIWR